jgi:hypothetical protein
MFMTLLRPSSRFEKVMSRHISQMQEGDASKRHVVIALRLAIVDVSLQGSAIQDKS